MKDGQHDSIHTTKYKLCINCMFNEKSNLHIMYVINVCNCTMDTIDGCTYIKLLPQCFKTTLTINESEAQTKNILN